MSRSVQTDTEKKIAEIREALEFNEEWWANVVEGEPICQDEIDEVKGLIEANRFLLSELDRAEKELELFDQRGETIERQLNIIEQLQEENRKLREERDKMIEVLRWYADTKNYEYRTSYLDQDAPIIDDSGQRARDILKEIGVTVDA